MRDSRLFDSVVSYASDQDDATHAQGRPGETEDPWRLSELESEEERPDSRLGQTLGTIRLEGLAGKGGMGTVFEGWDEKLQRKVAVKAISHRYRDHSEARQRFLREARLLSKLQHPNICQIHDHIEGEDGDYLVLELVEGRSLRSLREDGQTFTQAEGLRIARQLAAALVAAHDRGVAHRDLKPANIMVTPDGTVKVLDFGLGLSVEQAVEKESAEAGLEWTESGSIQRPDLSNLPSTTEGMNDSVTVVGGRRDTRSFPTNGNSPIEGTLAYMSPEQARSQEAGTASDIYSLGLVLQEVFTGQGAYPPDLPATHQLVRAGQGDTLPVTGIDSDLARLIERMKSVATGSRPSAPDVSERLRWIARKPGRRLKALALGAFVALLVAFSTVMAYQRSRIAQEAARANREAESARQVTAYLKGLFEVADPWNAESSNVTARELLSQGAEKIQTELRDQPLIRAHLLGTIGDIHRRLGLYDEARPLLEESLEIRRRLEASPAEIATSLAWLGTLDSLTGDHDRAVGELQRAVEMLSTTLDPEDAALGDSIFALACAQHQAGSYDEAITSFQEALRIRLKASGPGSLPVASVYTRLGLVYEELGRDEAEDLLVQAVEIRERLLPDDHKDLGLAYNNLASHFYRTGRFEDAIPLYRRDLEISESAYGPDHPDLAYGHNNLGASLRELGRFEEAEPHLRKVLAIHRQVYAGDHPAVASGLSGLAALYRDLGRPDEAGALWEQALGIWRAALGDEHPSVAGALLYLAFLDQESGRFGEAMEKQREALPIYESVFGSEHVRVAGVRAALGSSLARLGELDKAREIFERAIALAEGTLAEEPGQPLAAHTLGSALTGLAGVKATEGQLDEAGALQSRAATVLAPLAETSDSVKYDLALIEVLVALDRNAEAEPLARALLETGFRRLDFVELCREQGWAT